MLRLLILILLAWLVYRGIESIVLQLRRGGGETLRSGPSTPHHVSVMVHREEELVACARCGVRVPKSRTEAGKGESRLCNLCRNPGP